MVFRSSQYALTKNAAQTEQPANASRDGIFSVTENKTQRKGRQTGNNTAWLPSTALVLSLLIASVLLPSYVVAQASAQPHAQATDISQQIRPFNIPRQRADGALTAFGQQADLTVVYQYDRIKNHHSNQLQGDYKVAHAVAILLANTGLSAEFNEARYLIIRDQTKGKTMNTTNSSKRKTVLAGLVGLFAATGGVGSALAQGGEAATGQGAIDEIIVTANKREQSLQSTAMSISALSGDTVEKRGLVGMEDYLPSIPGVSMQDRGASQNSIIIRGIASDPQLENSNVGIYFGEIPVTNLGSASNSDLSGSADLKLVDIERIEVLRGPQGTLYGSGSMGGTVRVIPANPNLDAVEGKLSIGHSQTGEHGGNNSMIQGAVNIPVVEDKFAIRAVAYRFDNSGFIRNVAGSNTDAQVTFSNHIALGAIANDQPDIGNNETTGFRITGLWHATDSLAITLGYIHQELDQKGLPEINLLLNEKFDQIRLKAGERNNDEFLSNKLKITNLVVDYDLAIGNLLSTSSWIDYESSQDADISFIFGFPVSQGGEKRADVFTQEIRFASKFDGPIQLLAGAYYEDIDPTRITSSRWSGDPALDINNVGIQPFLEQKKVEQKAIFGELSYQVTEQLTATLGVRHFDYKQDFRNSNPDGFFTSSNSTRTNNQESGQTFKANLSYVIDDDAFLYGQWSEGFRLGRPQLPVLDHCDADNDGRLDGPNILIQDSVKSDTMESVELGLKTMWLDNRVTLNASIYSNNWDGIPVFVLGSCFNGVYANAGKSKSEGVEVEARAYLSENLVLDIGASYNDAYLIENSVVGNKGDNMPGSANFNVSTGLEYSFSLADHDAYIRGDYAYIGEYHSDFTEQSQVAGGYGQINLKIGAIVNNFSLDLFANNLTNENDLTWVEAVWGGFNLASRANRLRPRTIGLNIGYQF